MPTYEFRCPNGHTFDQFHRISDAPASAPCPTCGGGVEAERAISGGAGLVFKGSGFYLTDYGKNAHRGTAPAKAGDASGNGASGDKGGGDTGSGDKAASGSSGASGDAGGKSSGGASSGGSSGGSSGSAGGSAPKSDA